MYGNHLTYLRPSMTQFWAKSRSCVNICWSGLKTLSTNLHTKLEWNSISSSRDHVQEPTVWPIVLNRLCKWAYGGHIGLNQEIVLRASTTGVVLLLCKVSMISVWRQLRNSWSHIAMSQPLTDCSEPFMQISLWRPYWIKSTNCLTCINNRCCVTVVQGFIDFCLKTAEKQLITHCHVSTSNTLFWTVYAN